MTTSSSVFDREGAAKTLDNYVTALYARGELDRGKRDFYQHLVSEYKRVGLNGMATIDRDALVELFEEASCYPDQVTR